MKKFLLIKILFTLILTSFLSLGCGEGFELLLDDPPRTIGPKIISTTPSNGQTNVPIYSTGAPVTLKIIFDMTMNVANPVLTVVTKGITDNGSFTLYNIPVTNSTYTWSTTNIDNDTLTITFSWYQFAENTEYLWRLDPDYTKDAELNLPVEDFLAINLDEEATDAENIANNVIDDKKYFSFSTTWDDKIIKLVKTGQYECTYLYDTGDGIEWRIGSPVGGNQEEPNRGTSDQYKTCDDDVYTPGSGTYNPDVYPPKQNGHSEFQGYISTNRRFPLTAYPEQNATYTSDYTSTDSVTGLIWKTCSETQEYEDTASGDLCLNTPEDYPWGRALNACSSLNDANGGAGFAGRTDWRLPTVSELETLLDYGIFNDGQSGALGDYSPLIDAYNFSSLNEMAGPFPNTAEALYWTSSTIKSNTGTYNAYVVDFKKGEETSDDKEEWHKVRCVAGRSTSDINYIDNADGTITDSTNNRMWQKCSRGLEGDTCTPADDKAISHIAGIGTATLVGLSGTATGSGIIYLHFTDGVHGVAQYSVTKANGEITTPITTPASGQPISLDLGISVTFTDNGSTTFTSKDNYVISVKRAIFTSWVDSAKYCAELNFAGYNDWRLPNINELKSLFDKEQTDKFIDTSLFPNTQLMDLSQGIVAYYWSSTSKIIPTDTAGVDVSNVWVVDYVYRIVSAFPKKIISYGALFPTYTRCIRTP